MSEWLGLHWGEVSLGFVCGVICSPTKLFWERVLFAGGLVLAIYFLMVRAVAHAGFRWNNEIAALCLLGAFLGCLVRPALLLCMGLISKK
ncbi:hypothetical protein [Bradyrhizobium iriomotense]|uniref:Integron gene cassette protein n=1 Tax=Bradyrhizobium iriomotense TaxID=441950 RepID=A0ABQ6BB48_9BRAD|nr:hypothetical protein [Bradyrhizobium iriomotense]GLR90664.1 hypothetical protein GCM10007857_73790 [Bradyrhizobium iriomotense]